MDIRHEVISVNLARAVSDFLLPYVRDDMEAYDYYAAIAEGTDGDEVDGSESIVGLVAVNPMAVGPEIVSIGVSSEYEGLGIATELINFTLGRILENYDEEELDLPNSISAWVVGEPDGKDYAGSAFKANGFEAQDIGNFYEIEVSKLSDSRLLRSEKVMKKITASGAEKEFMSLKNTPKGMVNEFSNRLLRDGGYAGIYRERLDEDLTFFAVKDNAICACILFEPISDGVAVNSLVYMDEKLTDRQEIIYLFAACADAAMNRLSASDRLVFWIGEERTKKLIEELLPSARVRSRGTRYVLTFETLMRIRAERFESTGMSIVENASLSCGSCRHCTEAVLSCAIYARKPSGVLNGGDCPDHT